MKLFDDVEEDGQEVRIQADNSGGKDGSRLEDDAREKLSSTESKTGVTIEDIHEQNEEIIDLLKQINGEEEEQQQEGEYSGVL